VQTVGTRDPQTGVPVRDGSTLGQIAAGRNGALAIVWQDARFTGGARDAIALSRSLDGGLTWSQPAAINVNLNAPAFEPSIAIADDGTYGVAYFDLRSDTSSAATLRTDYWLAQSTDGVVWRESRISESFDLATAPFAGGFFVGDYQGIAAVGSSFLPLYVRTVGDANNRTDVFVAPSGAIAFDKTRERAIEVRARSAPPLAMTPALAQRMSDNVARTMEARVPGWSLMRGFSPR
jgi:hypothetical protein